MSGGHEERTRDLIRQIILIILIIIIIINIIIILVDPTCQRILSIRMHVSEIEKFSNDSVEGRPRREDTYDVACSITRDTENEELKKEEEKNEEKKENEMEDRKKIPQRFFSKSRGDDCASEREREASFTGSLCRCGCRCSW